MCPTHETEHANPSARGCFSRREFLLAGGTTTLIIAAGCQGITLPKGAALQVAVYPRKRIAALSDVRPHAPIPFSYPGDGPEFASFLVDVDDLASGGVGPKRSVVAFNSVCTHMGGPLLGAYSREHGVAGPCPLHLSTFDLKRHGMIVSGHATASIAQIQLEVEGADIFATGVMGLIYGLDRNRA